MKYYYKYLLILICICFSNKIVSQTSYTPHALLVNGGVDNDRNWAAYWRSIQLLYLELVNTLNFDEDNVDVLNADGDYAYRDMRIDGIISYTVSSEVDLDSDGDDDVNSYATRLHFLNLLDDYAQNLNENDFLFIYVTHPHDSDQRRDTINLWLDTFVTMLEFCHRIESINAGRTLIIWDANYSGNIIGNLDESDKVIITGADKGFTEAQDFSGGNWDRNGHLVLPYHLISAINGESPYGVIVDADLDNSGFVTIGEAFDYALSECSTSPQYSSDWHLGHNLTLDGQEYCITKTNLWDLNIQNDTIFKDCSFEVSWVTIANNANIEIDATNEVIISAGFLIESGSTLLIH
jgi:hypothetical protein